MLKLALNLAENGYLPDQVIRFGIRQLLKQRVKSFDQVASEQFANSLSSSPVAVLTGKANEQHYEVPSEYFQLALGAFRKYSSGHWDKSHSLDESEIEMLSLTAQRAEIRDGMNVLELGCGWGSFLLFAASKFPNSKFTGVSNSNSQREFILNQCKERNLTNVDVITADMTQFDAPSSYDRIVSVEMFEHMRNYGVLFKRISGWLKEDGKFFMHIFTHKAYSYPFEVEGEDNWMGRYFFSGGMMPAQTLPARFQKDLNIEQSWFVSGMHYAKTCEAWLAKQDQHSKSVEEIFRNTYHLESVKWLNRWRIFYLSCAELFAFNNGNEWFVSHYLFRKHSLRSKVNRA